MFYLSLPGLITTPNISLFTYPDGKGPLDYHNSSWEPAFLSDILNSADSEVLNACTLTGGSSPNEQCVFDAIETGDISIGIATMDTLSENMQAMTESSKFALEWFSCMSCDDHP